MQQLKAKKVTWDENEVTQLAEETALLRLQNPVPALVSLVNQAQNKLPEHRRRVVKGIKQLPGFEARVQACIELMTARTTEPTPEPPATIAELAATLFGRLEMLVRKIESSTTTQPPRPIEPPRPRKLVIAVVGLLAGQANDLMARTKGLPVELRCISKDHHGRTFPPATQEVVVFTKFVSHDWTTAAYAALPRERVHLHHGGVEQAALLVKKLVNQRVKGD